MMRLQIRDITIFVAVLPPHLMVRRVETALEYAQQLDFEIYRLSLTLPAKTI